jgi:hypothetical protein
MNSRPIRLTQKEATEIKQFHTATIKRRVKLNSDLKFHGATEGTLQEGWADKGGGINFFARAGEEYLKVRCLGGEYGEPTVQRHYSPHRGRYLHSPKYGLQLENERVLVRKNEEGVYEWLYHVRLIGVKDKASWKRQPDALAGEE